MAKQTEQSVFGGLKVVEIASFIAAPAAATMLSDFGADVIKVEPPGMGDPQRLLSSVPPSPAAPGNYSWHLANRNKRGMAIDLKSKGGTKILKRLVEWADVLITNYPHGTREALHLGYEEVSGWNPRIIYADITGFGDAGPDARLPGFDLTAFWSRSGLLASTRDAGAAPTSPPWGSGDYTTATAIYAAITTALYHRERTGRGANVGTSLLATGVWATGTLVSAALAGGKPYELHDRTAPVNAMTNPYQSQDDRWFMLAARQSAWPALAKAIGRSDLLSDSRFADPKTIGQHASQLAHLLDAEFRKQPLAHWKKVLDEARIPYGVVKTPEEAAKDPQLRAANIVVPIEGARDLEFTVNNPITLRGLPRAPSQGAPEHGEHNTEVLADLGFSADEINQLREQKAIPFAAEQETAR
ncbi:putative acyl-CoA transferase/carnitine dehydratase [Mycobacterium sp. JS623]|uniref:CaiB/BaiF CoA transferase family protein n=1 Tax=Mycobacterium sp. JS623 TaxID=212767 RepID=UPI0002A5B4E7|nr:CaiB/BaiF CoA-transferase family protein [Mycobacterium sp. JS623]AGB22064.1 putative acyl-CoA transferase/carnitine dehydratase [Mycobacterium sp. JS623]